MWKLFPIKNSNLKKMAKMCKVTVKGTGQLSGPVIINRIVERDYAMAQKFMGTNRYEVI